MLYIASSRTLLLISVVAITFFVFMLFSLFASVMFGDLPGSLAGIFFVSPISGGGVVEIFSIAWIFWEQPFGLGSPVATYFLVDVRRRIRSNGYLDKSSAPCYDLSTSGLLISSIYWVFGAHVWTCYSVLLYPMKIPLQFLWISDLCLFWFSIQTLMTLSKTFTWLTSCLFSIWASFGINSLCWLLVYRRF